MQFIPICTLYLFPSLSGAAIFKSFLKDESGATAIEYGLICALIFLTIVAGINALMGGAGGMYTRIGTNVGGALQ